MLLVATTPDVLTTDFVVWSICAGVCIAFLWNYIYKTAVGPLIRTLIAYEHTSEETALTLKELKMDKPFVKWLLGDKSPIRSYVSVVGGELPKIGKKPNFDEARFYIKEESVEKCKALFREPPKLIVTLLCMGVLIGISLALTYLIPILLAIAA